MLLKWVLGTLWSLNIAATSFKLLKSGRVA